MEIIKEHLVPIVIMLVLAVGFLVAEFVFGKLAKKAPSYMDLTKLAKLAEILLICDGFAYFVYLTIIGAGIDLMLPVMLLILLGALI